MTESVLPPNSGKPVSSSRRAAPTSVRSAITRRLFMASAGAVLALGSPALAGAQSLEAARAHVEGTIDAILELIVANQPREETARRLQHIVENRSALPQLARFVSGSNWSGMSDDQRRRFVDALSSYIAHVYAGYFRRYDGTLDTLRSHVAVTGASDAGAKGIVVTSEIRPINAAAIPIVWLVSDRSGQIAISDLSVAGISMALMQREIILAMFDARGGNAERMIAALEEKAAEEAAGGLKSP